MTKQHIGSLVELLKALSHPVRLRILALLRDGEHCVCQITESLKLPSSTTSEHLTELRRVGLISERREGRWVYYALEPKEEWQALIVALHPHLDEMAQSSQDLKASRRVRQMPTENICAKQRR